MPRLSTLLSSIAGVTLAAATVSACSGGSTPAAQHTTAAGTRDMLVIASQSDIGNLMSVVSESAADGVIDSAITFPLIDSEFDCSLKKLPAIATEWSWSDDGTVLSMTLRDDITFADGHVLTADDVAFTYELVADPNVASPRVSYIDRLEETGRPRVIDPTHIEWHFTQAYDRDTQMAHVSALSILPRHILGDADRATIRGNPYALHPLSTGPWKLAVHEPNIRIVLEPNENFTGPAEFRPHLSRVVFQIVPEYSTRLLKLESGDVDLMESILVSDADEIRANHPEINLFRRGWRSMDYVAWNQTRPLFQDARVRRALSMSLNIDDMIGKLLTSNTGEVYARRSVGTITPALCGVHNDDIAPVPFDATGARALMAEAGWTDTDGDGILDKDGEKFEFTFTTNTGNKRRGQASVLIQANLRDIGVVANIEKLESNTFFENLRLKDYDAALAGWSAGLFVDPTTIWHSDVTCEEGQPDCTPKKYEFNFVGYHNPVADALMERGLATPVPEEAAPIWKELQQVIYDDQPYTFLWWMDEIVGVNNRFEHAEENVNVSSPYQHLYEWSVPEDQVKYDF